MAEEFRQNGIGSITGRQGVGKSFWNAESIDQYVLDNPSTQKPRGSAIIYDVTEDPAYRKYPILKWKYIQNVPPGVACRLLARYPDSTPFDDEEKERRYHYLMNTARQTSIWLEDWNSYALDTKNKNVMGPITTARHNGCDIFFCMQNMSRIPSTIWENLTWYRFHKQNSGVDQQKNDISDFELLKIAEIIVNDEYKKAVQLRNAKMLTELEFKKRASYHVWVDFKRAVIEGVRREKFIEAALKMIQADKYKFYNFCNLEGLNHRNPQENKEAVRRLLISYMPYWVDVTR